MPEPLHVTPSENLGLGARSSTAKFAVPGSLLILITPPRRIRANIIDGRNKLGPVSFRADQTPDKLSIYRELTTLATVIIPMATGEWLILW